MFKDILKVSGFAHALFCLVEFTVAQILSKHACMDYPRHHINRQAQKRVVAMATFDVGTKEYLAVTIKLFNEIKLNQ